MQLIDTLIQGSVLFGAGYVVKMFIGFFVRSVRPVEQVDGLSEVAGEDLVQQAETIPPVMELIDIFADDQEVEFAEYDDPVDDALPAFPGDVEVVAEPDEVEPIGRPEVRCMAKAMAPEARLTVPVDAAHPALEGMSIRQLKKLASEAKIKRYSNLTKDELIERLRRLA